MRAVLCLTCALSAVAAAEEPGRSNRAIIDLSLRAAAPGPRAAIGPRLLGEVETEAQGAWAGPYFVEGSFALQLRRLPGDVRHILAQPVGAMPIVPESIAYERNFGLGLYVRLP